MKIKLKQVVQAMVKKWKPKEEELKRSYQPKLGDYEIDIDDNLRIVMKVCTAKVVETNRYNEESIEELYTILFDGSLADLIASPDAMAVFGEEKMCIEDHANLPIEIYCGDCEGCWMYVSIAEYHALEALKLIHSAGQEAAIDYLYANLKGEEV